MMHRYAKSPIFKVAALIFFFSACLVSAGAQTDAEVNEALKKGLPLIDQGKFVEALPYIDVLVKVTPESPELHLIYGVALLTKSKQIDDLDEAKKLSGTALEQFRAAKKLGMNDPRLDGFIAMLSGEPPADAGSAKLSDAEKFMQQAETYFAQSKYDEALAFYQKALALDPQIYEAALYSGDVYVKKRDWPNAEKSYQQAISIDPERETAYRYSATPLMKQTKYDQARDRYIEAILAEPYSDMPLRGISQWAEITGAKLSHPKIDIPEIKYETNGKPATVVDEDSLADGSKAWLPYRQTRDNWHNEKFAKTFPGEKTYRHSLQEETEAIRNSPKVAKEKKLASAQFEMLQKLENEGLLESYVLLALADQGIAQDYRSYWKDNRPKLRQYFVNYVIHK